jgi:hypothetical protein
MMPGMSTKTGAGADAGSAKALTEATPASVLGAVSNAPCVPAVQLTSAALRGPFSCDVTGFDAVAAVASLRSSTFPDIASRASV